PAGSALVDFLEYRPSRVDPSRSAAANISMVREPRLAAFVVRAGWPVRRLDLGPAQPIADAVRRWRAAVAPDEKAGPADGTSSAEELRRLVWGPLRPHLEGARTVFVSPDGALTRFPLSALP